MLLMSCKDASWSALRYSGGQKEGCDGVHLLLCRQFELARAVRHGLRPAAVRDIESAIVPMLHECFGIIPGVEFRKAPPIRCDICRLIDATKRVARSDYAEDFAVFLNETREKERERLSLDLVSVFQKYVDAVGKNGNGRLVEQVTRAVTVMQSVRDFMCSANVEVVVAKLKPPPASDPLEEFADDMASLYERIAALGKPTLRIIN